MKTLKIFALVALTMPLVFTSCSSDDDEPNPQEEPTPSDSEPLPKGTKFEVDGIYYNVTDSAKTTCEVTYGGTAFNTALYSGSVSIPKEVTYEGTIYSVTSIGGRAFYGCTNLEKVTISNSVTSIGASAFYGCTSLVEIIIGSSVARIELGAFYECTSLKEVTIPASVTSIGQWAFVYCSSLTKIEVDEDNKYYCSKDGVLYSKDMTELIQYPLASTVVSFDIPDGVTLICWMAFHFCKNIEEVKMPDSVLGMEQEVFSGCSNLKKVTLSSSMTTIESHTFYDCISLTEISIPDSVTSIGEWAFYRCAFEETRIPSSVTIIGQGAFAECMNLERMTSLNPEPPTCEGNAFEYVQTNTCVLYVPKGSKEAYSTADEWENFTNIVEME